MDETNEREISRYQMLENFLKDEALNDVVLKGTDGVDTPANRYLLAARSQVFRGMFLGKFQEASSHTVELGYQGNVLKSVVEYIYTDSAEMLNCMKRKSNDAPSLDFQQIQSLVSLAQAASYFHLPGLRNLVLDSFQEVLPTWPSLSFAVLQACRMAGPSAPDSLVEKAVRFVRCTSAEMITKNEVACLSADTLQEILKDTEMQMSEFGLFQVLEQWVQSLDGFHAQPEDRQKIATKLVKYICLGKINPNNLATTVTSSGLVTPEQLLEAYKHQALAANKGVETLRKEPKWTTSALSNNGPADKIKVEGAGEDAVNGVYVRNGSFDSGTPKYSMHGVYEGDPCIFWICISPTMGKCFITILGPNSDCASGHDDIDFYVVARHVDLAIRNLPPRKGWKVLQRGVEPPPKLLYNFNTG